MFHCCTELRCDDAPVGSAAYREDHWPLASPGAPDSTLPHRPATSDEHLNFATALPWNLNLTQAYKKSAVITTHHAEQAVPRNFHWYILSIYRLEKSTHIAQYRHRWNTGVKPWCQFTSVSPASVDRVCSCIQFANFRSCLLAQYKLKRHMIHGYGVSIIYMHVCASLGYITNKYLLFA